MNDTVRDNAVTGATLVGGLIGSAIFIVRISHLGDSISLPEFLVGLFSVVLAGGIVGLIGAALFKHLQAR